MQLKKMNNKKIAVYGVCKNEEKHVRGWFDSIKNADYILLLDIIIYNCLFLKIQIPKLCPHRRFYQWMMLIIANFEIIYYIIIDVFPFIQYF